MYHVATYLRLVTETAKFGRLYLQEEAVVFDLLDHRIYLLALRQVTDFQGNLGVARCIGRAERQLNLLFLDVDAAYKLRLTGSNLRGYCHVPQNAALDNLIRSETALPVLDELIYGQYLINRSGY